MTASTSPRISVVMAVYNGQHYLRKAVESILRQTYADFEFIIVDDGSTDRSRQILREYASADPRIRFLECCHQGLTKSLNYGLTFARGELIARMDADDIAVCHRFQRQVDYLDAHSECVALGSAMLLIDPDDAPLGYFETHETHEEIDAQNLRVGGGGIGHPSAMIRHAALKQVGAYREQFPASQDGDLFLRLAEVGRLANLPEALIQYRVHLSSITIQRRTEQAACSRRIILDACRRRGVAKREEEIVLEPPLSSSWAIEDQWAHSAHFFGFTNSARKYAWRAFIHGRWKTVGGWCFLAFSMLPWKSSWGSPTSRLRAIAHAMIGPIASATGLARNATRDCETK